MYTLTPRSLDQFVMDLRFALQDMSPDATLADTAEYMDLDAVQLLSLLAAAKASGRADTAVECTGSTQVAGLGLEAF